MQNYWNLYLVCKQQQLYGPVNYRVFPETGPPQTFCLRVLEYAKIRTPRDNRQSPASWRLACSQTLYFLFTHHQARLCSSFDKMAGGQAWQEISPASVKGCQYWSLFARLTNVVLLSQRLGNGIMKLTLVSIGHSRDNEDLIWFYDESDKEW